MSKNYNRYGEESKKTDKYGMTDEKNENAKTQKKENCYGSDSYDKSSTNRYSDKKKQSVPEFATGTDRYIKDYGCAVGGTCA